MAIFPDPPVFVYSNFTAVPNFNLELQHAGPFQHGGALYVVTGDDGASASPGAICVFKSTDNGATWTQQDSGNHPVQTTVSVYYPGSGNLLYFAFTNGSSSFNPANIELITFDMSTDLWGSVITSAGPTIETVGWAGGSAHLHCLLSNGDWTIFYMKLNGSGNDEIYYATFTSGGSWTNVGTLVSTNTDPSDWAAMGQIFRQSNDTIHILWTAFTGADASKKIFYRNLVSGTLSSVVTAYNNPSGFSNQPNITPVEYLASSDTLICGFDDVDTSGDIPTVLIGTPSASPSWSRVYVIPFGTGYNCIGQSSEEPQPTVVRKGSTLYAFWAHNDVCVGPPVIGEYLTAFSTDSGATWSTPVSIYDVIGDPPSGTTGQGTEFQSVTLLSNGNFGLLVSLLDNSSCNTKFYFNWLQPTADLPFMADNTPQAPPGAAALPQMW